VNPHRIALTSLVLVLASCLAQEPASESRPEVAVGRLICGGHLPLAVVEKKFQDDLTDFRLKTVQNHDWLDVIADMQSGKLVGTFILSPLALKLIRDGLPAKIVLMADRNGNGFILSKRFASIEALKGNNAVIAVPHLYSQHHVLLHLALKQHGVSDREVTVIAMSPRDMIVSMQRGEIDGFMVGEPEGNRSLSLDNGWMAATSPTIWRNHPDHLFLLSTAFIEQHPEQAQELISALRRAGQYIESHPHEAAVMGEDYTGASAPIFEEVLTTPPEWIDYSEMIPSDEQIVAMANLMVEMGLWPDVPSDLGRYVDRRFILNASGK